MFELRVKILPAPPVQTQKVLGILVKNLEITFLSKFVLQ